MWRIQSVFHQPHRQLCIRSNVYVICHSRYLIIFVLRFGWYVVPRTDGDAASAAQQWHCHLGWKLKGSHIPVAEIRFYE